MRFGSTTHCSSHQELLTVPSSSVPIQLLQDTTSHPMWSLLESCQLLQTAPPLLKPSSAADAAHFQRRRWQLEPFFQFKCFLLRLVEQAEQFEHWKYLPPCTGCIRTSTHPSSSALIPLGHCSSCGGFQGQLSSGKVMWAAEPLPSSDFNEPQVLC